MTAPSLARALRDISATVRNAAYDIQCAQDGPTTDDLEKALSNANIEAVKMAADLVRVLAHVADGMDVRKAFGSPGDWGYDTPIGDGVIELINAKEAK